MKHIVRKPYRNHEKEEKWLNQMAAQGKALIDYSWCRYVFEDAPKGEYIYRIEFLDKAASHPDSQEYIAFVEETGAEHVASYMRWVYFRKKITDGSFEIYTGIDSRLKHYKRINTFWLTFAGIEFGASFLNLTLHIADRTVITHTSFILGLVMFCLGVMFLLFGCPIRRQIRRLKREKNVSEG